MEHLFEVLGTFKRLSLTIIVAEQNVELGLMYAERGAVLHLGRLAMTAPKVELAAQPRNRASVPRRRLGPRGSE